ncbi:PAS domain S-box protein [Microvirga zambiensis]|uniref:PAS domain S-box protein n=1 Tax=Microvirga zambiensis TaxID=1402137 RepID=UPI00191CCD8A|nr:PAS domain S-box protein [Microvirga zambiensis]
MPPKSEQNGIPAIPSAQGILDAVAAPIAVLDQTGTIVATNRAWQDFGHANQARDTSQIGVNYLEVCTRATGGDAPCAKAAAAGIRSVLAGARTFVLEDPCHSPNEQRWFQLRVSRLKHDGAAYAVVIHHDITARILIEQEKQAYLARAQWHQEQLKALAEARAQWHEEQLKALAEASARIGAASTPEATLQEVADQAREIIGAHWGAIQTIPYGLWPHTSAALSLSEECLQGSALAISMAAAAISTQVIRSGEPMRLPTWAWPPERDRHDGQEPTAPPGPLMGILAVPLVGAHGGTMGAVMLSGKVSGEFTPEDQARLTQLAQIAAIAMANVAHVQAMRNAKERLLATQEHASVGIGETDLIGQLVMVNARFCSLTGYSRSELLTRSIFDLADPASSADEQTLYQQHVAGELKAYALEQSYVRQDGSVTWFAVTANAVFDEQGQFRYSVRVIQPVDQPTALRLVPANDRL